MKDENTKYIRQVLGWTGSVTYQAFSQSHDGAVGHFDFGSHRPPAHPATE